MTKKFWVLDKISLDGNYKVKGNSVIGESHFYLVLSIFLHNHNLLEILMVSIIKFFCL